MHLEKMFKLCSILAIFAGSVACGRLYRHAVVNRGSIISQERDMPVDVNSLYSNQLNDGNRVPKTGSVTVVKSEAVVYKHIDGNNESYEQRKSEVQKDGRIVARVQQEMNKREQDLLPRVKTMLEIPSKNVQRVLENGSQQFPINGTALGQTMSNQLFNTTDTNKMRNRGTSHTPLLSPMDIAQYVFWTGDDKGGSAAIQEFLNEGLMNREEALTYLEEVKQNLKTLERQYSRAKERPKLRLVRSKYVERMDERR